MVPTVPGVPGLPGTKHTLPSPLSTPDPGKKICLELKMVLEQLAIEKVRKHVSSSWNSYESV